MTFSPNFLIRAEVSPVEERFIQMSSEGLAWCPNLTVADTSLLLPLMVGVTFAGAIFISNNKLQMQTAVSQPKVCIWTNSGEWLWSSICIDAKYLCHQDN